MGLIDLIKVLSNTQKTRILGENTAKILRFTFTNNEFESIPGSILDEALTIQLGADILKKKYLSTIIECLDYDQINSLGFENYDEAIDFYSKNKQKLVHDFQIEDEYLEKKEKEERREYEYSIPEYGKCNGVGAFLHPYQLQVKKKIAEKLFKTTANKVLGVMPTGAGKTILAMELLTDVFRTSNVSDISLGWFVDSSELAEQSFRSFQKNWKQRGDRIVRAQRFFSEFSGISDKECDKITFATFFLLHPRLNTEPVINFLRNTDLIVIDEAHSSNAETYLEVITRYLELNPRGKVLGLTATPHRSDDNSFKSIKGMFNEVVTIISDSGKPIDSPIEYLVNNQYLAKIDYQILNTEKGLDKSEYFNNLHFTIKEECKSIIERGENSIIFAQSKSHAIALSIFLKRAGIENELIVGETPLSKRKKILEDFGDKKNKLSIIVNHQILQKGIDVPGMNSIMVLPKIESPTLALQILGRAMRGPKNGGNNTNTIYLTKDNYNRLGEYQLLESEVLK